ncbi:MAG: hypothetical protein WCX88_00590 [Patescibacteria group bacterium]
MNYKNKYRQNYQLQNNRQLFSKVMKFFEFKTSWRVGLSILTLSLVLVYLFQINCLAITGFEIKELERDIYTSQQANKELTLQVAQLQSINNLEKVSQDLAMVKIDQAEHVNSGLASVALNK